MGKLYVLLAACLLLSYPGAAQKQLAGTPAAKQKFTSIRLGPSLTTIAGKDVSGNKFQAGAHAAISYLSMDNDKFGIETELQYSFQGTELNGGHLLLHYINVPLTARLFLSPKLGIQGGGYGGLLLKQRYEYEAYRASPNVEGMDYGLAYGLSFGNVRKATLHLRHQVGLANIGGKDVRSKNQVLQLSVAYCVSRK